MRFNIYRTSCRGVGGVVDYLGEINAPDDSGAERKARELFDFMEHEGVDVQRVCVTCNGTGSVTDELEDGEVMCCHCDGSGEVTI